LGSNGRQKDNAGELSSYISLRKIADAHFTYEDSKYVIFGVPFDQTSSFRKGSSLAPDAVRIAYDNLESFDAHYGVDFGEIPICDLGNLSVSEDPEEVVESVQRITELITGDGKIPIMIGGEHSITSGAIRNFKNSVMIIIDAHSDFRDEYMGSKFNHACITHRALEVLGEGKIFSFGTRSISREEFEDRDFNKVKFIRSEEVLNSGINNAINNAKIPPESSIYFSIDMDGMDPSYAPAVGTPEPYGIKDTDVRALIRKFSKRIVGFDVLEFSPVYDNGNTAVLAAKLIQDFIGSREMKN
jgi:arginase/agmatinase